MHSPFKRCSRASPLAVAFLLFGFSNAQAQTVINGEKNTGAFGQPGYQTPNGGGNFVFANDSFTGGVGLNPISNNEIPGAGLVIQAGSSATVQSGNYQGGDGSFPSGFRIAGGDGIDVQTALNTTITGGTFIGGYEGSPGFALNAGVPYVPNPVPPVVNHVFIYGGTFLQENQDGTIGTGSLFANESIITLYGYDLKFLTGNGSAISPFGSGVISGTLVDNSVSTDINYIALGLGQIILINEPTPVPEASTTVSFGLLLALGMGGVVIAAKKKKANASA